MSSMEDRILVPVSRYTIRTNSIWMVGRGAGGGVEEGRGRSPIPNCHTARIPMCTSVNLFQILESVQKLEMPEM